ncbi:Phosphate import ATP-binding protein PstB 3 [Pelotomaculum sp. FP]|uniref:phosphate ABC transporter ATP-binding protein n=1 Tax=Pelotomaculum sp. FP TaxID=261474 RepID=UPI00106494D5|nr:phosphate ABC transporter ATP-binding protein [Pelotomaculum sp. FP]TEB15879.1 Phosphate import ATP-binding protein PstB 3 [Pelotomaculum sp. FP]
MVVKVENWNVFFGKSHVLKDITLEFRGCGIFAVIGPSGCGKTTLLKSINRTAELDSGFNYSGAVLLEGENIYQKNNIASIRRRVGMVFQTPVALPMSVKENVLFGPRYFGEKNKQKLSEICERSLRHAGLWEEVVDKLNRPAGELSGGQKQRLSIARALAVDPEVLLLDEPCSSLDPASSMLIERLLTQLSCTLTIVLVTHNLFQAKRIADETVLMMAGKIVEYGPSGQFFSKPLRQETVDFISGLTW